MVLGGDNSLPSVKIHPSVIFEILNCYTRREDRLNRVIGTLLGITKENCIEVLYLVPIAVC